jgi:hypothetical protein
MVILEAVGIAAVTVVRILLMVAAQQQPQSAGSRRVPLAYSFALPGMNECAAPLTNCQPMIHNAYGPMRT